MNKYECGAIADIGVEREKQEDFVHFKELDDNSILCVIADGTASRKEYPQPAAIISMEITDYIYNVYTKRKEVFLSDPVFFLEQALMVSNKILGGFKIGNEEMFSGYAASVTCCLLLADEKMYVAHSGNTRLYMIRNGVSTQLTKDHTKAAKLLDEGKIDPDIYHVHPDRLKLTSGIGVVIDPEIQTFSGKIKDRDILLMTTDGIHYAIRQNAITDIVLKSHNCRDAAANLVNAAKNIIKYPDNMSAMLIHKK